jgi:uncharacterized protein (TIGR02268 family)
MPALPLVLLASLLLTGPAVALPAAGPCQTGVRHVEVPELPQEDAPQVCVSPGQTTVLDFDDAFVTGSVALEEEERFTLVDPARSTLKLVPSERLRPGERLRLTVRFPGTASPASATLLLVVHAAMAEPLVHVHRMARAADSYRQELAVAKEEVRRCQEDIARLRAEQNIPGGLAGLLASGVLGDDAEGVLSADLSERIQWLPSSALSVTLAHAYRAPGRVALRLRLENPAGAAPWAAEGATLAQAGRTGAALKVLTVWQRALIPGGGFDMLVVDAEAPENELQGPFVLKLWEAGGTRTVTLGGVTFP